MDEYMELGDLLPKENGWYVDKNTGNTVSPNGDVYDHNGELIWTSDLNDEDYERNS